MGNNFGVRREMDSLSEGKRGATDSAPVGVCVLPQGRDTAAADIETHAASHRNSRFKPNDLPDKDLS